MVWQRDSLFCLHPELWLHADGTIPMWLWFIKCLCHFFPSAIAGQSMRAGGATALAEAGTAPHLIQTAGRWTSDTFNHYMHKNPFLFEALLIGRSSLHSHTSDWFSCYFPICMLLLSDRFVSYCLFKLVILSKPFKFSNIIPSTLSSAFQNPPTSTLFRFSLLAVLMSQNILFFLGFPRATCWGAACWGFGYSVQAPRGEVHVFRCGSAGFRIYTVLYVLILLRTRPYHTHET